ncbi:MAG: hypothetical protein JOZ69_17395, partial [Myxococcales bacterium]|nr:hypothetical protein [Myxococcales bacterium]
MSERARRPPSPWAWPLLGALSACGSSGGTGHTAQDDTPWGPCPQGFHDECRTLAMPLDYADPSSVKIPVFVSRAKSLDAPRADLWLVQGGPGESADVFDDFVDQLRATLPGFDVYTF